MLAKSLRLSWALLFCLAAACMSSGCHSKVDGSTQPGAANPGEVLFCHWNVENFFDDKADKRPKVDQEYDAWFSSNKADFQLKLSKLTEALLKMNDGRGPDILSICEVECVRAAELLKDALNAKLDASLHYKNVLMKEVSSGRHIAPAIITRLNVDASKTHQPSKTQRILEANIIVGGQELTVIAGHWTSRLQGGEDGRAKYADAIYHAVAEAYHKDPKARVLVCGDFNDTPQDVSVVKHLHSSGNINDVQQNRAEPLLYNLFADKDPAKGFGTHFYNGKWFIFDQILVSPGLLGGNGLICDVASVQTSNSLHRPGDAQKRPWRFGNEHEKGARGYSDHFPVTVKLRVN